MSVLEDQVVRERLESKNLLKYANKNRQEGFFNDVCINVEAESIPANRLILACNSPYFERMFKTNLKERYEPSVKIEGAQGKSVKAIINFFYSESIEINSENVMSLLAASDYLQVNEIRQFCFDYLRSTLSPKNSLEVLNAVSLYNNEDFMRQICAFISTNFDEVFQTIDFKFLSKEELSNFLFKLDKKHISESSLYKALMIWIEHNPKLRQHQFATLFQQIVDPEKLSIDFIEEVLLEEPLITSNAKCHQLVLTAFSKSLKNQKCLLSKQSSSKVIGIVGRQKQSISELYSVVDHQTWMVKYPDIPTNEQAHGSNTDPDDDLDFDKIQFFCEIDRWFLKLKNTIFYVDVEKNSRKFWKMNLQDPIMKWSKFASVNQERCNMGAVVHQDGLVVAGGNSMNESGKTLSSVEFYQVGLDKWKTISPMKKRRSFDVLVSCLSCLYSLGGVDLQFDNGNEALSSVERINDLHGEWEHVQPMHYPRCNFAAVNCDNKIYAIGGDSDFFSDDTWKSVERYDPIMNAWSFVEDLHFERAQHSACVLNGKIFVFGGRRLNIDPILEIECYDPENDTWTIVGVLKRPICGNSVVVV